MGSVARKSISHRNRNWKSLELLKKIFPDKIKTVLKQLKLLQKTSIQ